MQSIGRTGHVDLGLPVVPIFGHKIIFTGIGRAKKEN